MENVKGPAPRLILCEDTPTRIAVIRPFEGRDWGIVFSNPELGEMFIEQDGKPNILRPVNDDELRDILVKAPAVAGFIVDCPVAIPQAVRVYTRATLLPETN